MYLQNSNPYYWMWGVNRWLSARFNLLSGAVVGITGFVAVMSPNISASTAGFALAFASTITVDVCSAFVGDQSSLLNAVFSSYSWCGASLVWNNLWYDKPVYYGLKRRLK